MIYGGVNYLAVLVATVAGMASGAVWYGALARPWQSAAGLTPERIAAAGGQAGKKALAALAKFVIAFCLAKLLRVLDAVSIGNSFALALFLWLGFVAMPMIVNHRFQLHPWRLPLIDGGYWLLVLALQGLVIGFFG